MKALIKQPGRVGDLIICLPIAEYYSQGFEVFWECPAEYHSLFRNIDYCKPIVRAEGVYDKIIDISFGLTMGTKIQAWWNEVKDSCQSFVNAKYFLAEVPLYKRWTLKWNRNFERENALYKYIVEKHGTYYHLVHEKTHSYSIDLNMENKVIFEPIEDYNIFDWYKVILCAASIHCIDSCLANFVDTIADVAIKNKYFYQDRNKKSGMSYLDTILINNWQKGIDYSQYIKEHNQILHSGVQTCLI